MQEQKFESEIVSVTEVHGYSAEDKRVTFEGVFGVFKDRKMMGRIFLRQLRQVLVGIYQAPYCM